MEEDLRNLRLENLRLKISLADSQIRVKQLEFNSLHQLKERMILELQKLEGNGHASDDKEGGRLSEQDSSRGEGEEHDKEEGGEAETPPQRH